MSYGRRPVQWPTIHFQMYSTKPLNLEMDIQLGSQEGWELFALLRDARRIRELVDKATPNLEAANLLVNDPSIRELISLVQQIPNQAHREHHMFMVNRQPVSDMHHNASPPPPSLKVPFI